MTHVGKTQEQLGADSRVAALKAEEATHLETLAATDWYVARLAEAGTPIPESVTAKRASARERISAIREELEA